MFRRNYEDPRSDEWAISPYINRRWYNFLNKAITNKEDFVSKMDGESLRWWLKGFCDSEANVDPAGRKGKYVQIQIYNSDRKLCGLVKSSFERLGYSPEIYEKGGFASSYRVSLQKTHDVLEYDQRIGFTIKRKSKALEKAVSRHREKAEFIREKYKKFKQLKQEGASLREIERTMGSAGILFRTGTRRVKNQKLFQNFTRWESTCTMTSQRTKIKCKV